MFTKMVVSRVVRRHSSSDSGRLAAGSVVLIRRRRLTLMANPVAPERERGTITEGERTCRAETERRRNGEVP